MLLLLFLTLFAAVARALPTPTPKNDPMMNEGLYGGDMRGVDLDGDRNAVPRDDQTWPNGIVPYYIDGSLNKLRDEIIRAMKHIEHHTCIRFKSKSNERAHIRFFQGEGCWAHLGRTGNAQEISLGNGCEPYGTILHEILHALGFEHEHQRSDRDNYINIFWENIEPKWHFAFNKLRPDQNRIWSKKWPFDWDSVMLYGSVSFTKQSDHQIYSMLAKDNGIMRSPFDKHELSPDDIYRIQKLYKCR